MCQHFLLSAKARTLSLASVARMSEDEARGMFRKIRWAATDGEPVCPECGCVVCYEYASRPIFKCKACERQFSVTSGTLVSSRKLPMRDYLLAIAIFVNGAKGVSALQLSRDLDVQYKTAFVLAHKLREAMALEHKGKVLRGHVEIDGAYFGGHVKPANRKADRVDRRLAEHQTGKRRCVVAMRERGGRTLPFVVISEDQAVPYIRQVVAHGTTVYADKPRPGMPCMLSTTLGGSITASPSMTKARTPTKPSRSSRACAAPRSASIIASAATCTPTRARWRGARITGASRTALSS
jgi:transposase-like protein